jgi:hypothetical protein
MRGAFIVVEFHDVTVPPRQIGDSPSSRSKSGAARPKGVGMCGERGSVWCIPVARRAAVSARLFRLLGSDVL